MSEQETLAWDDPRLEAAEGALCPCGHESLDHAWPGCEECVCKRSAINALLSSPWLASVLADDATVEVVARAMLPEGEGFLCAPWERVGTVNQSRYRRLATAGLDVLSAHLTAPVPGGVAARKQEADRG